MVCEETRGGRRSEYDKVINPLEHQRNLVHMENFYAGICRCTLDSAHRSEAFNGIVLHVDVIMPADGHVFLESRDDRGIPVGLNHV